MSNTEPYKLRAFLGEDTEGLLRSLGLWERFEAGEIKCLCDGATMTPQNFGGVVRLQDQLLFFCDNLNCFAKVLEIRRAGGQGGA